MSSLYCTLPAPSSQDQQGPLRSAASTPAELRAARTEAEYEDAGEVSQWTGVDTGATQGPRSTQGDDDDEGAAAAAAGRSAAASGQLPAQELQEQQQRVQVTSIGTARSLTALCSALPVPFALHRSHWCLSHC